MRGRRGDFGLGFFGHSLESGAYYVQHPDLGELCYLCDLATVSATDDGVDDDAHTHANTTTGGAVSISPRDSYHSRVFIEPLSLYLYAETGTIHHVALNLGMRTLSVVFDARDSNHSAWGFSKLRLLVDKTSQARPGSGFTASAGPEAEVVLAQAHAELSWASRGGSPSLPLVRGAYEIDPNTNGKQTTIVVTWAV